MGDLGNLEADASGHAAGVGTSERSIGSAKTKADAPIGQAAAAIAWGGRSS